MAADRPEAGSATTDLATSLKFVPTPAPTSLRDEVAALIEPWRNTDKKPPFTTGELIVMTFVMSDKEEMSDKEIHSSILRRFSYYCHMAIDFLTDILDSARSGGVEQGFDSPTDDFYDALRSYELPLQREFIDSPSSDDYGTTMVRTTFRAARIYLSHRLEPDRLGNFDFMQLSAELREKIYKMLLVYPSQGLSVQPTFEDEPKGLVLTPTHPLRGLQLEEWEAREKRERELVYLPSMGEVLAILRVSKKIYSEALPVFYRKNLFHFPPIGELQQALGSMEKEVRQMIDHMQIDFDCLRPCNPSFRQLRGLATVLPDLALKTLILQWPEHGSRKECLCNSPAIVKRETSLSKNPSLVEFIALARRAKKLELEGNDTFKTWLENKLGESGTLVTSGVGKVDSSKKAVREP
ncbi:hypothetical protein CKM354_001011000 [Cercospora kikuchii]|uniref:DUF7730 domain-containing protein n=1 Tax=Cercospora kikuchii TaxID=84275 RepID=A0A9P3CYL2_9PEZI|nr:uncharacterized protein CKM354_001011000 [Cercospora kikuchii]GIZ47008.1 hypothetical protein CKM354_001011000 [Cercospora kikuchii]